MICVTSQENLSSGVCDQIRLTGLLRYRDQQPESREILDLASTNIIEIIHVVSCINMCRVPRKLFEHETTRPNVQTSSEGPGKC